MPTIPIKDYLYLALLILLVSGFVGYTIHERHAGAAAIQQADIRAVIAAQKQHESEAIATQTKQDNIGKVYENTRTTLVVNPPHIVCVAPGLGKLPAAAGEGGPGADDATNSGSANTFDPGPDLAETGKLADAKIIGLQSTVKNLQRQLEQP